MGKDHLNIAASIAGILGLFIAVLALARDTINFTIQIPPTSTSLVSILPTEVASAATPGLVVLPTSTPGVVATPQQEALTSTATTPPTPTPTLKPLTDKPISLKSIGNDDVQSLFPEFNRFGSQKFGGVDFVILEQNGKASTSCLSRPQLGNWPAELSLEFDDIDSSEDIYILINAGYTTGQSQNEKIGQIDLTFRDGSTFSYDLILGQNIREWRIEKQGTVGSTSDPDLTQRVATFKTGREEGDTGIIDMLRVKIPKEYQATPLHNITFRDTRQGDPCFSILGVTVSSRS